MSAIRIALDPNLNNTAIVEMDRLTCSELTSCVGDKHNSESLPYVVDSQVVPVIMVDIRDPRRDVKPYKSCRICYEGVKNAAFSELISPCKCTGSLALIHRSCLEHWLTVSSSDRCEICQFRYTTINIPPSCKEYFKDQQNNFNIRNLMADIICFLLLTPLLVVSTYLCYRGANQYFGEERVEAVGLIVLSSVLFIVYLIWCHITIRYHKNIWKLWQKMHHQVRVILPTPVA